MAHIAGDRFGIRFSRRFFPDFKFLSSCSMQVNAFGALLAALIRLRPADEMVAYATAALQNRLCQYSESGTPFKVPRVVVPLFIAARYALFAAEAGSQENAFMNILLQRLDDQLEHDPVPLACRRCIAFRPQGRARVQTSCGRKGPAGRSISRSQRSPATRSCSG
eukprot:jgi/Ulvmu1/8445/UM043_0023.1